MESSTILFKGIITHTGLWGAIISTIAITLLGFILYKTKVLNDKTTISIQKIIINVLLPFLAFYSFLQNAQKENLKTFGVVFGLSAIYYFVLTAIALVWVKYAPKFVPKRVLINAENEHNKIQEKLPLETRKLWNTQSFLEHLQKKHLVNWLMCIYGSNILFATPIVMALYPTGPQLGSLSIWNILYYIGGFGFAFSLLSGVKFTKKEFGITIKKAVTNASFIVVAIAIALWATQFIPNAGAKITDINKTVNVSLIDASGNSFTKTITMTKMGTFGPNFSKLYGYVDSDNVLKWFNFNDIKKIFVPYAGKPTGWFDWAVTMPYFYKSISLLTLLVSPLIWIVIGTSLGKANIKQIFSNWQNWLFLIYKMILIPIFILCLVLPFVFIKAIDYKIGAILVMTGAVPPGTSIVIYSQHFKVHEKYTAQVSSLSTMLSFIFIPMWLAIGTVILHLV